MSDGTIDPRLMDFTDRGLALSEEFARVAVTMEAYHGGFNAVVGCAACATLASTCVKSVRDPAQKRLLAKWMAEWFGQLSEVPLVATLKDEVVE